MKTTEPGYMNANRQQVVCRTDQPGTDHLQYVYILRCTECGFVYGANGSDIHLRKCPSHGDGKPGLHVPGRVKWYVGFAFSRAMELLSQIKEPKFHRYVHLIERDGLQPVPADDGLHNVHGVEGFHAGLGQVSIFWPALESGRMVACSHPVVALDDY